MSVRFKPVVPAEIHFYEGVPYAPLFGDVYFSKEHGFLESMAVFIEGNDLVTRFQTMPKGEHALFVIGELGFGTGLNVLLAWQLFLAHAPADAKLVILTTEKHPLRLADLKTCLDLWPQLRREAALLLDAYPVLTPGTHVLHFEDGRVNVHLMLGDAEAMLESRLCSGDPTLENSLQTTRIDAWFLDGFAPSKNQALWSPTLFEILALLSYEKTTLATFSVAGEVRRGLEKVGFIVEKKTGFGGKRHRLQGYLKSTHMVSQVKAFTPWVVAKKHKLEERRAIVVGAGLAGCYTAHALASYGFKVTVLDSQAEWALGASGNPQMVLFPNLSGHNSPLTSWMLHAFLFAARQYKTWLKHGVIRGELEGILQLNVHKKSGAHHDALREWLTYYPELGELVNAKQTSALAGISVNAEALFVPFAGWLDSQVLCDFLMTSPGIDWHPNTSVNDLIYENNRWHVSGYQAQTLILANGMGAASYEQTRALSSVLSLVPGQMSAVTATQSSRHLKRPLCGVGHVIPFKNDIHWFGASYSMEQPDDLLEAANNADNLQRLHNFPVDVAWSDHVLKHWTGIRVRTRDHLPIVGPVPNEVSFYERFKDLAKDGRRFVPEPGVYQPGLYVCSGFGSRGLTSIPLAAEYLVSIISGIPSPLSRKEQESISPTRFLIKTIKAAGSSLI